MKIGTGTAVHCQKALTSYLRQGTVETMDNVAVSSYFTSGENKSNCLDHISPIESESEADHILPLVKVNVIVRAVFHS